MTDLKAVRPRKQRWHTMRISSLDLPSRRVPVPTWKGLLALGFLLMALGSWAQLAGPWESPSAFVILGWLTLIYGVADCLQALQVRRLSGFPVRLTGGLVGVSAGLVLINHTVAGLFYFTVLFTWFYLVSGSLHIYSAFSKVLQSDVMLCEGMLTVVAGLALLAFGPFSGPWFLGIALGVVLWVRGCSYVSVAISARRLAGEAAKNGMRAA